MQLTPENYKVSRLLKDIDEGVIALPEFQRDFVWKPPLVADMLRTLLRQWPPGTFLLLEVEDKPDFSIKSLEGAPPLAKKQRVLILDGQQRSTAIYQALRDRADETYFVRLAEVADAGEFDDDHLKYAKKTRFVKTYKNVKEQAGAGVVPVPTLWNAAEWQQWLRELPEDKQDRMIEVKEALLPGAGEFEIPSVRLPHDADLPAIAKIFETLNRRGVRLATFDLMVARLYPSKFYLKDKWEDAQAEHGEFERAGIDDGIEVLKVIALREHIRQREADVKLTIKGIRESDVLNLVPETVIAQWDAAVQALVAALRFVEERCGVIRPGLMPSATMLHPIASVLAPDAPQRDDLINDLTRWFWASTFRQTYAQAANTQAVADARALRAWQSDPKAVPDVVANFRLDDESLMEGRSRNEMLVRGILCRSVLNNARDWCLDKRFIDLQDKLEIHHVFPSEFLKKHYTGEKDPIANFVALSEATNKKLRNALPKDVLDRPDVSKDAIKSHSVDLASLKEKSGEEPADAIRRFLEARVADLKPMIYAAVGVKAPKDSS